MNKKRYENKGKPVFWWIIKLPALGYLLPILLLFASCNNTKFLGEDEKLYTRTSYTASGFGKVNNKPLKLYEMYLVGSVKTNSPFPGLPRLNLAIYNYWKPSGSWGPRHYIHRVFGKPPLLLEDVNPDFRAKVMKQRLFDMGHFDSEVTAHTKIFGKYNRKARTRYHVLFRRAYTYRNIDFYNKGTVTDSIIQDAMPESYLKPGNEYWLKEMDEERDRLNLILKNKGHYFFNPDYLIYHADTTPGDKQVDLTLILKDDIPERAYKEYSIRNLDIHVKSNWPKKRRSKPGDSVTINSVTFVSNQHIFKPKRIVNPVSLHPGQVYTVSDHENTLRFLQGMRAFKSVNISFKEVDSISNLLDARIDITPLKPYQTAVEVNFASKSNDFLGPAAIFTFGHRNIFLGAEKLTLKLDGGFEWQRRSRARNFELGLNSYEIGAQLKLGFPRFLVPFNLLKQSPRYVPETYTSIGFRTLKRVRYYRMNLSQVKFGYSWRTSPKRLYKLEPVSVDYLKIVESSDEFDEFLVQYPQVAKSFEEQFIIGSVFSYTYTNNPKTRKKNINHFFYNGTLDLSGNLLNAVYNLTGIKESGSDETGKLFGTPYAQFTRLTNDIRYYIYITEKRQIALRFLAGVGVPYNNSSVLPYVKQYFAGGSQDMRSFYARSLGPGSYSPPDTLSQRGFLDQSGEIKLLGSIEYRFPITYNVYGAGFIDMGNVWLINEDESRPGGKFEFNEFIDDIALGSGVGIRVDIEYFIVRLDAGVPVRKPFIPGKEKWIFHNSSFWGDFILSLAVGYPF